MEIIRPLLLGDRAYPFLPWLLKPYANNVALTPTQQHYNRVFSSARVVVERAFGVLKGRWRILLKRMDNKFFNVPDVILACCILHNFCQQSGEEFDDHEVLRRVLALTMHWTVVLFMSRNGSWLLSDACGSYTVLSSTSIPNDFKIIVY